MPKPVMRVLYLHALHSSVPLCSHPSLDLPCSAAGAAAGVFIIATIVAFFLTTFCCKAPHHAIADSARPTGAITSQQQRDIDDAKPRSVPLPVVIIEPDQAVGVGWALCRDSVAGERPVTKEFPGPVPIMRAPTLEFPIAEQPDLGSADCWKSEDHIDIEMGTGYDGEITETHKVESE